MEAVTICTKGEQQDIPEETVSDSMENAVLLMILLSGVVTKQNAILVYAS